MQLLLRPQDVPPSQPDLQVMGVFNPGAVRWQGEVVLLVRVAERPSKDSSGRLALPRWQAGRVVTDLCPERDADWIEPGIICSRADGLLRLTFTSHLQVVYCGDGRSVRRLGAKFFPEGEHEEYGMEDPRLTIIGDRCFFTYVAVSRHGISTALASTTDFVTFHRHGVVFAPENKDVALFPEKIGGQYVALHRPVNAMPFARPQMWLARSADLSSWGSHEFLYGGSQAWESGRVGAGPSPIRTEQGWLVIYHGSRRRVAPGQAAVAPVTPLSARQAATGQRGAYYGAALLLDLHNPHRILRRSKQPILEPRAEFERHGFVPNVVFPTGIVECGETLLIYSGAADENTSVVELSTKEILNGLEK